MARPRSSTADQTLDRAMHCFWTGGYEATSMAELVASTGSTRQTIYADFESKHGLYRACFDLYRNQVVEPALEPFVEDGSGLDAIARYFEIQISLAEKGGLPGPGCMVGNAMTETAHGDAQIAAMVEQHNARLERAFASALPDNIGSERQVALARFLVLSAQGLWATSRVISSADELRARAETIIALVKKDIESEL